MRNAPKYAPEIEKGSLSSRLVLAGMQVGATLPVVYGQSDTSVYTSSVSFFLIFIVVVIGALVSVEA